MGAASRSAAAGLGIVGVVVVRLFQLLGGGGPGPLGNLDGQVANGHGGAAIDRSALRSPDDHRWYVIRAVRRRLHQTRFRQVVIGAYGRRCTICRLREERLSRFESAA
ncbi:MAG: hypothetical protein HYX33_01850 [Actinobacteria bacterium]|nr:hypothetical protein [Actinomycetota bacterium]